MDYTIEKDIPYPESSKKAKYPFQEMEIGDSFAVEKEKRNTILTSSQYWGMKLQRKFSVKRYGEAYRCWRIA